MAAPDPDPSTAPRHAVLCLGDALVDLIAEGPAADLGEARTFTRHLGGVVSNVAVIAARAGARVALAGAAGADPWGRWIRDALLAEGVDISHFHLLEDAGTPVAFVHVSAAGEPTYTLLEPTGAGFGRLEAAPLLEAVDDAAGLFLSTNTLAGAAERELTMTVRERALERSVPVVLDVNLRLHRWRSRADAAASANACIPGALLVRANAEEAAILTGEEDPERAATALLKTGARAVVLSLGERGAMLRGELRADAEAPPLDEGELRSTLGAGDVLTGMLLARLAVSGFYLPAAAAGLREAVGAARACCARWGALD